MHEQDKSKELLLVELRELRRQVAELEGREARFNRIEEELRESETRLRQIIDLVPHQIFVKDPEGRWLLANKATADAYGKNASALIGKHYTEIHPDKAEAEKMLRENMEVITTGETKFIPEEIFTDARGRRRYLQTTKVPFRGPGDKVTAVLGIAIDITESKQAEEVRREREEQFRTVVQSSPNPILILQEGCFVFVNNAAVRMYGAASPEELLGGSVLDRIHPDYRDLVLDRIESSCKEGKPLRLMEQKHLRLDGKIIDVEVISSPIRYRKSECAMVFVRDVSEQKRMEDALRRNSLYTRSLIEATLDPLMTINREGKITDANRAAEQVTGFSRKHLIGSDFSDHFTEPQKAKEGCRKAIKRGFVRDYPLTIRHASGLLTDVIYNAAVYTNEAGELQGVLASARDITERKRAEAALRESRAYLAATVESIPFEFWVIGLDGHYTMQNRICKELYGDIIGKNPEDISPNEVVLSIWEKNITRALSGEMVKAEVKYFIGDDEKYYVCVTAPIHDADRILGIVGINIDITDRKLLEIALKEANEELETQVEERTIELSAKNSRLEEFNSALKVLLAQREVDKKDLEESILANVKKSILPFLRELKKTRLDDKQKTYLDVVESNLNDIVSPFLNLFSSKFTNLTPMEIKVAKLIREGKTSKEIAQLLGVAEQTILTHRNNLRAKLGLRNARVNLHSHLLNLK